MTDLRKAVEMALKAFKNTNYNADYSHYVINGVDGAELITALTQALAQGEQEPVAWMDKNGVPSTYKSELYSIPLCTLHHSNTQGLIECTHNRYSYDVTDDEATCRDCGAQGRMIFVVNGTAPPSKQESVEYDSPALYKAKSEREQAEKQEPDAWLWLHEGKPVNALMFNPCMKDGHFAKKGFSSKPLYTAPVSKPDGDTK